MLRRIALTALVTLGVAAPAAGAATHLVDDDLVQCPTAAFTSIQAAITAAAPGDQVLVCQGFYTEQVTVGAGKDGLRVNAKEIHGAIIESPNILPPHGAIVRITDGVQDVRFDRFQVQGPGTGNLLFGILVDGGAEVDGMRDLYVRVIRNNTVAVAPGTAIQIGSGINGPGIVRDLNGFRLERFVEDGINVREPGSEALITHGKLTGTGDQGLTANGGIVVRDGALARVTGNQVTGHAGLGTAFGILFDAPAPGSSANNNRVYDNEVGIGLRSAASVLLRSNDVKRNGDGIDVDSSSAGNTMNGNDARTNRSTDCADASAGGGTAGTANTWTANRGVVSVPAGICTP